MKGIGYYEIVNKYIKNLELSKKKSTTLRRKQLLLNTIPSLLFFYNIKSVTPKDLEKFQHNLLTATDSKGRVYSNHYMYRIQETVKLMFSFAFNYEYIDRNPWDKINFIKRHIFEEHEEHRIITLDQYYILVAQGIGQAYKTLFSVMFWCGLRPGETLALQIKDVDFKKRILKINKNWDSKNKIITTTKTERVRNVSIPNVCLLELRKLVDTYKTQYGTEYDEKNHLFVYRNIYAKTTLDNTRKNIISSIQKEDPSFPYFTFQDLRHSHVSLLINAGMESKDIAERLGHSVEMVNNTYGHLYPERKDLLLERLNNISNDSHRQDFYNDTADGFIMLHPNSREEIIKNKYFDDQDNKSLVWTIEDIKLLV